MRTRFISHMVIYFAAILVVLFTIQARFYTMCVIWALFTYIIVKELIDEFCHPRRRKRLAHWPITFNFHHVKIKGDIMEFQLQIDEVLPFRLGKPVNNDGAEAPIESGSLQKVISDTGIFTEEQDDEFPDDPEARMFVPVAEGTADYTVTADADLGAGVETISLKVTGTVIAAGAVGFAPIQFGTPRKKTAPALPGQG